MLVIDVKNHAPKRIIGEISTRRTTYGTTGNLDHNMPTVMKNANSVQGKNSQEVMPNESIAKSENKPSDMIIGK